MDVDPYENIYTVIRGTKRFVLLPPTEGFLLAERKYPRAEYVREKDGRLNLVPIPTVAKEPTLGDSDSDIDASDSGDQWDPNLVSWASIDPMSVSSHPSQTSSTGTTREEEDLVRYARPIHVELNEGESLYLPSGWWHHVSQSSLTRDGEDRGACIAINWWYDLEMRGDRWVWLSALRRAGQEWARARREDSSNSNPLADDNRY